MVVMLTYGRNIQEKLLYVPIVHSLHIIWIRSIGMLRYTTEVHVFWINKNMNDNYFSIAFISCQNSRNIHTVMNTM